MVRVVRHLREASGIGAEGDHAVTSGKGDGGWGTGEPRAPLAHPGVQFPPPILFVLGFGATWLLDDHVRPLPFPGVGRAVAVALGVVVAIAGLYIMIWGIAMFRKAMTAIFPNQPANELVTDGAYRFTRNPMYVGFTLVFVGAAFIRDSVWPLIVLPFILGLLYLLVIRREEAYLADAFGEQYASYCRRVRRWF
jgi:protein-S-isoprenylcysteine O-methyltransferase Ste14